MNDESANKDLFDSGDESPLSELWFKFLGFAALTGVTQIAAVGTKSIPVLIAAIISYICLGWWATNTFSNRILSFLIGHFEKRNFKAKNAKLLFIILVMLPILLLVFYLVWVLSTALISAFGLDGLSSSGE